MLTTFRAKFGYYGTMLFVNLMGPLRQFTAQRVTIPQGCSRGRDRLEFVAGKLLSAPRRSITRTKGRVVGCVSATVGVFARAHCLFSMRGAARFGGVFALMRRCRSVYSRVRISVTGCLGGVDRRRVLRSLGQGVYKVLHRITRVRDVKSDYRRVTRATQEGFHDGRRLARGRLRRVRRVFRLARRTLRLVGKRLFAGGASGSVSASCCVRRRVGGFHGRLHGRGFTSMGRKMCGCRANAVCVSIVGRYRRLSSYVVGIVRTYVRSEGWRVPSSRHSRAVPWLGFSSVGRVYNVLVPFGVPRVSLKFVRSLLLSESWSS